MQDAIERKIEKFSSQTAPGSLKVRPEGLGPHKGKNAVKALAH